MASLFSNQELFMARALVTGGSGFLGQYLVRSMAEAGWNVSVVDIKPSKYVTRDIAYYCNRIDYGIDVTKPETLQGRFDGIDVIYHLAGIVSFWSRHKNLLQEVNVKGTQNVLSEAMRAEVSQFVHVSSVAAIGCDEQAGPEDLLDETFSRHFLRMKHKHYMMSKHLAEREVLTARADGLNTVIAILASCGGREIRSMLISLSVA